MIQYGIYVPEPSSVHAQAILPGSAIVAREKDIVKVFDFEGNKYGASNLERYSDRLSVAVGRSAVRYPTTARIVASESWFRKIGRVEAHEDGKMGEYTIYDEYRYFLASWLRVREDELDSQLG